MVTKKARHKKSTRAKKAVSKRRASSDGKKNPTPLRTAFMADFTETFIRQDNVYLWPVTGQQRSDIVTDFQTFVAVLSAVGYGLPAPVINTPLGTRLVQFLGAPRNWPSAASLPSRLKNKLSTVTLVEIAVILDRLLEAINAFQLVKKSPGGGSGRGWPPH